MEDTQEDCGCATIEVGSHWWTHTCPEHRGFEQEDRITPKYTREEIDAATPNLGDPHV